MRLVNFRLNGRPGIALHRKDGALVGRFADESSYPGSIAELIARGGSEALVQAARHLEAGAELDAARIEYLPPISAPARILCLGLNYKDHAAEANMQLPEYPSVFVRFASTLIGHDAPLIRPRVSTHFDYEGELAVVIGRAGRHISSANALAHVCGYSVFNDASVRDYQMRTSQWTMGKNFDATGPFGPVLVTADELPPGAAGLKLETRLNGKIMQSASTAEMIFDVKTTISLLSEVMALMPGDLLVMGTPSGVGFARKPPIFMKAGDLCEVSIEGIGLLSNRVVDEAP
jgi:acylpyruvate hydrolase